MLIVGIGGTASASSSSERVLQHSLAMARQLGAETEMFSGSALDLPPYAYGAARPDHASALVDGLRRADGLILCSPGYHGTVSGLFKNAIDYAEDLARDDRPYFDGKPVGVIGVAAGWQAAVGTLSALRDIVHALRGWPSPLGIAVNSAGPIFDEAQVIADSALDGQLKLMAGQLTDFIASRTVPRIS